MYNIIATRNTVIDKIVGCFNVFMSHVACITVVHAHEWRLKYKTASPGSAVNVWKLGQVSIKNIKNTLKKTFLFQGARFWNFNGKNYLVLEKRIQIRNICFLIKIKRNLKFSSPFSAQFELHWHLSGCWGCSIAIWLVNLVIS